MTLAPLTIFISRVEKLSHRVTARSGYSPSAPEQMDQRSPGSREEGTRGCRSMTHLAVTRSRHSSVPGSNEGIPVMPLVSGYRLHLPPTRGGCASQHRLLQGETPPRSLGNLHLYFCFSRSEVSACSWRSEERIDFPCRINTQR